MNKVIDKLQRRRKLMFMIIFFVFIVALSVDTFFTVHAVTYFEYKTQQLIVYGLVFYKLIELVIIYLFFYHRHIRKYRMDKTLLNHFEKNAKRFFMLVPQGNIVFGILSYKLTGNVEFLFLFLLFAVVTLYVVDPGKIKRDDRLRE